MTRTLRTARVAALMALSIPVSAGATAVAGSLYAIMFGFVDPESGVGILISVKMLIMAALGGAGMLFGPLVGALILVPLEETSNSLLGGKGAGLTFVVYGAIIVIPVLLILATTGLTYLYRAQVDAWTHPGVLTVDVPPKAERLPLSEQEDAVRHAYPDRTILSVTDNTGDRATVFVTDLHGETHNIYVDPYQAKVTGDLTPNQLVSDWAERIHGTILLGGDGGFGDTVIELGACWAIVLTITGFIIFFLGRRPRKNAKTRGIKGTRLRSWHALIGLPVGLGILLLVLSGLPWTGFWGTHAQNLATDGNTSLWGNDPGAESTLGDLIEATDGKSGPAGWAVAGGPTGQSETSAGQTISIDTAIAVPNTTRSTYTPTPSPAGHG